MSDPEKHVKMNQILEDHSIHITALDARVTHISNTMQDLQAAVKTLNESMQRALQELMPKVETLLSSREADPLAATTATSTTSVSICSSRATSLLQAADSGDVETVVRLIKAGENILQRNQHGDTALHLATIRGHEGVVACLIGYGIDVNLVGPKMRTALHHATANYDIRCVQLLLSSGGRVDLHDAEGFTPLMLAVRGGDSQHSIVELIAQKGVSLDNTDKQGNSAMVIAAKIHAWNIVKLLCDKGASAAKYKLMEHSPLVIASENGQTEVVTRLLKNAKGIDDIGRKEALSRAGGAEMVWAFEDSVPGTLQGEIGDWALMRAAQEGRLEPMVALLDAGVNINSKLKCNSCTALIFASSRGQSECVKVLLERGALPNEKDNSGNTALLCASMQGYEQCVWLLLNAGADVTIKNNEGKTALDIARTVAIKKLLPSRINYTEPTKASIKNKKL